tara:strand:- start:111 stop:785 length:675 start_codon:yes stop_codon:yes gene_type:complete
MNKVSVIIRVNNEERWIGHTIQSILDNIKRPEIIVVDDYSTDKSIEIVNRFKEDPLLKNNSNNNYTKIIISQIQNYTPGKALNMGVNLATNNTIMIISSHCVLNKIKLSNHINDLKKYVCIFGNQIPVWEGKKIVKRYIWSHFVNKKVTNMYSTFEDKYFLHNAIAIYNRDYLKQNKFDENLTGKEDRYWADEEIKKNKKILYDPSLEVFHHYTENGNTWKGLA